MCRYLVKYSINPFPVEPVVRVFSQYAKTHTAPDGDWQGDGWGALAYHRGTPTWKHHSLSPIWMREKKPPHVSAQLQIMHARSATHKNQLGDIRFNQPYTDDQYVFVFNGYIQGLRISSPYFSGTSGAQRIWSFLQKMLQSYPPLIALEKTVYIINRNSKGDRAINIALSDLQGTTWAYSFYNNNPSYYQTWVFSDSLGYILTTGKLSEQQTHPILLDKVVTFSVPQKSSELL